MAAVRVLGLGVDRVAQRVHDSGPADLLDRADCSPPHRRPRLRGKVASVAAFEPARAVERRRSRDTGPPLRFRQSRVDPATGRPRGANRERAMGREETLTYDLRNLHAASGANTRTIPALHKSDGTR